MLFTGARFARNLKVRSQVQVRTMAGGGPRLPPPGGYKGIEHVLRGVFFKEDWQFAYFMIGLWGTIIWAGKTFIKIPEKPAVAVTVSSGSSDAPSFVDNPDEWVKWLETPGNIDKFVAELSGESSSDGPEILKAPTISLEPIEDGSSTKKKDDAKMRVGVTTYNILSEDLCDTKRYPHSTPEYLQEDYRNGLILSKISSEINKGNIICLQETSLVKSTEGFKKYFEEMGYFVISEQYKFDAKKDFTMGPLLAFPTCKYELIGSTAVTISDTVTYPKLTKFELSEKDYGIWKQITEQRHKLIAVKLKDKLSGEEFVIANYHMPCIWQYGQVMAAQAAAAAQAVEKFAGDIPYIFCGDYNFKPREAMYTLYTTGTLPDDDKNRPPRIGDWKFDISVKPLRSAYFEINGQEPKYTNLVKKSSSSSDSSIFAETLDFIFLSKHWTVDAVKPLELVSDDVLDALNKGLDPRNAVNPNDKEPSDHILLAADLSLRNEKNKEAEDAVDSTC